MPVWVAVGDVVYLVVAVAVVDAQLYSSPLMMLFTTLVAAWFLGPRALTVQTVALFAICAVALAPTLPDRTVLAVQVLVQGGVLTCAAVVVYLLRRRSDALLAAMYRVSTTDFLTGLPNRRHLEGQMPALWSRAHREGWLIAALVLDLDRFKEVNDQYGHAVGDAVLRAVADTMRRCLRGQDVVARTGGEELVVVTLVHAADEARVLAERLRVAVAQVRAPAPITASVGIAVIAATSAGGVGREPDEATWRLVEIADGAMYQAKRGGRNRSVLVEAVELTPPPGGVDTQNPDRRVPL